MERNVDGQPFGEDFDWPSLAVEAASVGRFIWYIDAGESQIDPILQDMTGLEDMFDRFPVTDFIDQVHPEDQQQIWMALSETRLTGTPFECEFRFVRSTGETLWLLAVGQIRTLGGGEEALLGATRDITAQRNIQERYELVAGEMEHRVKNLLTMVASIFRRTARSADTVEGLSDAFLPRLRALSTLNELAARAGHKAIDLSTLVESILQPVQGRNIKWEVAPCHVNGTAGQTLALVLNELMTNAVKYGGLADEDGEVHFEVRTDDRLFTIIWSERASYEVSAPVNSDGFGMQVLNNMTSATFSGRPRIEWRREGIEFRCEWPLDKMLGD